MKPIHLLRGLAAGPLAAAAAFAAAQTPLDRYDAPGAAGPAVHVVEAGRYTVRASAVNSLELAPGTAERHGIEPAADRGVLNLVVLERRDHRQVTVPARVTATQDNLLGQTKTIEMREVAQNGRVAYFGTFEFAPLRNFRFVLTAQPAGGDAPLTIEFEDRFTASRP